MLPATVMTSDGTERIGVFGGTFDPVHVAHIVAAVAGDAPGADHLEALALGVAASPLVASGHSGPEDLAAAALTGHRAVLLASRSGYAMRERERGQLIALGRIADRLWTLLSGA